MALQDTHKSRRPSSSTPDTSFQTTIKLICTNDTTFWDSPRRIWKPLPSNVVRTWTPPRISCGTAMRRKQCEKENQKRRTRIVATMSSRKRTNARRLTGSSRSLMFSICCRSRKEEGQSVSSQSKTRTLGAVPYRRWNPILRVLNESVSGEMNFETEEGLFGGPGVVWRGRRQYRRRASQICWAGSIVPIGIYVIGTHTMGIGHLICRLCTV